MLNWYDGVKVTPNEYARLLILDKIDELLNGGWEEDLEDIDYTTGKTHLKCTEKELAEVRRLLRKRAKGVYNYLGYTREDL